jgi:hypothetical protein
MTKLPEAVLPTKDLKPSKLRDHMLGTYRRLRKGLLLLGFAFPVILVAAGRSIPQGCEGASFWGITFLDSMSAYYHAGDWSRNLFVGVLLTIGALLALYKGFTPLENRLLNAAGVLVAGVALFPNSCNGYQSVRIAGKLSLHGASAILFFLCLAAVSWFCAEATLPLLKSEEQRTHFERRYRAIAILFVLSPMGAALLSGLFTRFKSWTFWLEALGVWIFGYYWLTKTRELESNDRETEKEALQEELELKDGKVYEANEPAPVAPRT